MSDLLFMLESHLSPAQSRVVAEVQAAAAEAAGSLFLTGGAMRDMLGGFPIRDIDFTIEGDPVKLAKTVAKRAGGEVVELDSLRKRVELRFPGDVTAEIAMSRVERYAKAGGKPQVSPAGIHEDLRCRDFTIDSIALSLKGASRGLLLDPTNGQADLERRELRANYNYALYDDPSRMLRLVRLKARLGFAVEERTQAQFTGACEEGMLDKITVASLFRELRQMAEEPNPADLLKALEEEDLLRLFCKSMTGVKVNHAGMTKLVKAKQNIPFGVEFPVNNFGIFLHLMAEKLNAKEKAEFISNCGIDRSSVNQWRKLEPSAKVLERAVKSAKLQKPSRLYSVLHAAPGEQVLFLLVKSEHRLVHDRIKNYLQKYLPLSQEVTDADVSAATGLQPGTPKFKKAKEEAIATRLDARPKKPAPPPEETEPPPAKR